MTTSALAAAARERALERVRRVGHDAHVDRVAIEARQHPVERVAVAVVDLARGERRADRLQLVAGREERDAQLPVDGDLADAERGHHPELRGAHELPRLEHDLPALQVLAGEAAVLPAFATAPAAIRTRSPSALARSCITTVSAPAGITPPVKMRTHCPGPTVAADGLPANDSPTRARVVSRRARDRRSAPRSRPSPSCRGRERRAATRRRRRARDRAPGGCGRARSR